MVWSVRLLASSFRFDLLLLKTVIARRISFQISTRHLAIAIATMAEQQQEQDEQQQPQQTTPSEKHVLDKTLIEPYHYINAVPGKDVRGKLIDCFNLWLNVPQDEIEVLNEIKAIVADLHNASLLIDDIEDNSKLRRGVPVAHSIFGVAPVINTANYVYFLALERCHGLKNEGAMKVRLHIWYLLSVSFIYQSLYHLKFN